MSGSDWMSLTIENTLGTLLYSRYYRKVSSTYMLHQYLTLPYAEDEGGVGAGTYLVEEVVLPRYLLVGCAGQSIHTPRGF